MSDKRTLFTADVRLEQTTAVIDLRGEINGAAEAALDAAWQQVDRAGAARVVLNFTAVNYINSTGIALIVGLLARSRAARRAIAAVGLSAHYREIFTITRLSDFIEIVA